MRNANRSTLAATEGMIDELVILALQNSSAKQLPYSALPQFCGDFTPSTADLRRSVDRLAAAEKVRLQVQTVGAGAFRNTKVYVVLTAAAEVPSDDDASP